MTRRRGDERSFRFELTPNGTAADPSPRAGKGGGRARGKGGRGGSASGAGGRGRGVHVLDPSLAAHWNGVDVDALAAIVPQLERSLVLRTCERERARGTSVQGAIDALLSLTIDAPAIEPAAPLAGAKASTPGPRTETPWLARLPDELLAWLFTQLGAGYVAVGVLGLVCRDTLDMTRRWLSSEVKVLRFTGRLRKWADGRMLGLIKASAGGLERLEIDCSVEQHPTAQQQTSLQFGKPDRAYGKPNGAQGQLGLGLPNWSGDRRWAEINPHAFSPRGFVSFGALFRMSAVCARLKVLHLKDASALDESSVLALVSACASLSALNLVGCANLTDGAALALAKLRSLAELSLSRNPQLSARACQATACCLPCVTKLDLSHGGQGTFCLLVPRSPASRESAGELTVDVSDRTAAVHRAPRDLDLDDLDDLPSVTEALARPVGWEHTRMPKLLELSLSTWRSLKALTIEAENAPLLRKLDVGGCEQLLSLSVSALSDLHTVNASHCHVLHTLDAQKCPALAKLNLAHCKSLRALAAPASDQLASLSLFGCRSLGVPALEAMLGAAGEALRSLDLNGTTSTESLTEESIRATCPYLTHLDARGRAFKFS